MKKVFTLMGAALLAVAVNAETVKPVNFGNFDQWVTRNIPESQVLGGKTKKVYEIGPTQTINGAKAYSNLGGSPWATSNVMAKVMGVVKTSCSVVPEKRGNGYCVKMMTVMEHAQAAGIIDMDVLANGTIFMGNMMEPITSSKNPYSKMNMGIPYTKRPKYLQFDYKVTVPSGTKVYSSGFGPKKTLSGQDYAEVFIILQRRWEDSKGNIHAARVGTGRERFGKTVSTWQNGHRLAVHYGDITKQSYYKSWMGLLNGDRCYYAKNSKGKMVKVLEEKWDSADATPTHVLIMASSGCGTPYTGIEGMTFWIDNMAFVY